MLNKTTIMGFAMTDGMIVSTFEVKSHDAADEVRSPDKTRVEIVRLPGYTLGRLKLQPGWRWSECIKPVVGTASCQVPHVGYAVSGRLTVRMTDGTQKTLAPGMSYTSRPGTTPGSTGRSLSSASRS